MGLFALNPKNNSYIYTISNFSNNDYPQYFIKIPKGKWELILNTDDCEYGGNNTFCYNIIESDGENQVNLQIPANSFLAFRKI